MNKYKKENKITDALVYIIIIVTLFMTAPLIYRMASHYNLNSPAALNEGENPGERISRIRRRYTVAPPIQVDISELRNTEHGRLNLIAAQITDSGHVIMFCNSPSEYHERAGSATRIAVWDGDNINIFPRILRSGFGESIAAGNHVFKDYSDGTVFISNNRVAFLFDYNELRYVEHFMLPEHFNIYQAVLSNDKSMLAIAAEEGFFVVDTYPMDSPLKELIASSSAAGVLVTARQPFWSSNDDFIFYKNFADEHIRNAGMTTVAPGWNEQLTALDGANFIFLKNDIIFYYFSSGSAPHQQNLFRCGYFDPFGDRRMQDIMRSQVYYFDIAVSPHGTLLAALSHNGNMVRLVIIDIRTKQQIYSGIYDAIYNFSFSPNERNFIIHGRSERAEVLNVIKIDWEEE